MYISLYRRYRPQTFSDVIGQEAAIGVITRAIETGTVGHAYLFSGPRGCGKTTVARLFAKAVNCPDRKGAEPCNVCGTCHSIVDGSCLDVIEIDGASNNKVDEVRTLKEHISLASFTCPYKVYIIDEVHMLSAGAFNALLKTLEEPPERVIFILATTEPYKVPVTVRSRCQHIPFHGMTASQIVGRLEYVTETETVETENEALWEIARNSEGGMRDALSLLEQAIAFGNGKVTEESVSKLLGGGSSSAIRSWISCCHSNPEEALPMLEGMFRSGAVAERFLSVLFVCIRNLWLQARWGGKVVASLALSKNEREWLEREKTFLSPARLERLMAQVSSLLPHVRRGLRNDVLCGLLVSFFFCDESSFEYVSNPIPSNPLPQMNPRMAFQPQMPSAPQSGSITPHPQTPRVKPEMAEFTAPPLPTPPPAGKKADVPPPPVAEAENVPQGRRPVQQSLLDADVSDADFEITHPGEAPAECGNPDVVKVLEARGGMTPKDGLLAGVLESSIAAAPEAAIPLLLSDIIYDDTTQTVYVCFDESEHLAWYTLNNGRVISEAVRLFKSAGLAVATVHLACGARLETFSDFDAAPSAAAPAFPMPQEEKKPDPTPEWTPPSAEKQWVPPEIPGRDDSVTEEAPSNLPLREFIGSLMGGEVLYCRPRDEVSENIGDDEDE